MPDRLALLPGSELRGKHDLEKDQTPLLARHWTMSASTASECATA